MKRILDRRTKLFANTTGESLHEWSLIELDENGSEIGLKQIPWKWSLTFDCSDLACSISAGVISDKKSDVPGAKNRTSESEVYIKESINGTLSPQNSFSFFGTSRWISNFKLVIIKVDDTENEGCNAYGSPSWRPKWESVPEPDLIVITIYLRSVKFDQLKQYINNKEYNSVITLSGVDGFYSEWTPGVTPDGPIKVLSNITDQEIEFDREYEFILPYLGFVEDFKIYITKKFDDTKIEDDKTINDQEPNSRIIQIDDSVSSKNKNEEYNSLKNSIDLSSETSLISSNKLLKSVNSCAIALWIIAIIYIFRIFFR